MLPNPSISHRLAVWGETRNETLKPRDRSETRGKNYWLYTSLNSRLDNVNCFDINGNITYLTRNSSMLYP